MIEGLVSPLRSESGAERHCWRGGGPEKANAIRALLMSGVVNTAVIDLATARLMLDQRMGVAAVNWQGPRH